MIPRIAITTRLIAEMSPAAENLVIQSFDKGKNNKAMHGKTNISPIIIEIILFKLPFNITEYIDENIAAKQAIENKINVKYNAISIISISFLFTSF